MKSIRIVTDSGAHLTNEEIQRYGITVVPMRVRLGRRVYKEGADLTTNGYFHKLEGIKSLPASQPPQLQDFIDTYYRLSRESDEIISIHTSSRLSPVYDIARTAAAGLRGRTRITVVDSETISRGLGMVVRCAGEAGVDGANLAEASRLVRGIIPSVFLSFFIDDLAYPERDGRIRKSQGTLGSMFSIKPLVEIREGDLIVMEKVRTQFDVVEKLATFIGEFAYLKEIALLQHGHTQDATALLERLEQAFPSLSVFTDTYNPTLATFIGPTALGVVVREDTRIY